MKIIRLETLPRFQFVQIESNFFFAVFRANLAAESAGLRQCHTKYATDPHFLSSNDASLEVRNVHVSMSNGILSNLLLKQKTQSDDFDAR